MAFRRLMILSSLFGVFLQVTDSQDINVYFYKITRKDGDITYTKIESYSELRAEEQGEHVYVKFHGYQQAVNRSTCVAIYNALFDSGEEVVIGLDYGDAVQVPYDFAVNASYAIGEKTAKFFSTSATSLKFVGVSLGTHVAGMTSQILRDRYDILVERIIALDPALPLFSELDADHRLEDSDANFVMAVHTGGGELGYLLPLGHVDFYPNEGVDPQPHCLTKSKYCGYMGGPIGRNLCNHCAGLYFLVESVKEGGFISTKCSSWEDFKIGLCDSWETVKLGFNVPTNVRGMFFLRTRSTEPFGAPLDCNRLSETEAYARSHSPDKKEDGPFLPILIFMAQFISIWLIWKFYPYE